MKRLMCLVCVCWVSISVYAQTIPLQITTDKTTSLVFPFPVLHVDCGTAAILVQSVKEADHFLLVKAAGAGFTATNLSVITSDGSIYSFAVSYSVEPDKYVYHLPPLQRAAVATYASGILDNPRTIHGIRTRKWEMEAVIVGIYIKENMIYYQLQLVNKSPVDYDIELLKFYIRDKRKNKRTAVQENEVVPIHLSGNTRQVKAGTVSSLIVALDKFTIPDAKYLAIQVMEKNGGRHLLLKVNNQHIIRAITLPDLH